MPEYRVLCPDATDNQVCSVAWTLSSRDPSRGAAAGASGPGEGREDFLASSPSTFSEDTGLDAAGALDVAGGALVSVWIDPEEADPVASFGGIWLTVTASGARMELLATRVGGLSAVARAGAAWLLLKYQ